MALDNLKVGFTPKYELTPHKIYEKYLNNADYKQFFVNTVFLANQYIKKNFPGVEMFSYGRIKSSNSYLKKLDIYKKEEKPPVIFDIYALKFVVSYVPDNYETTCEKVKDAQLNLKFSKEQFEHIDKMFEFSKEQYEKSQEKLSSVNSNIQYAKDFYNNINSQNNDTLLQLEDFKKKFRETYSHYCSFKKNYNDQSLSNDYLKVIENDLLIQKQYINTLRNILENNSCTLQVAKDNISRSEIELLDANEQLKNNLDNFENNNINYENAVDSLTRATDSLNISVSEEISNFLICDGSEFLKSLNAYYIPQRRRNYNKEDGYISTHSTIVSNDNSDFKESNDFCSLEMQFRSIKRDEKARESHSKREGKQKTFPKELLHNCKSEEDFLKILADVPSYIIINDDGDVIDMSTYDCFCDTYSKYLYETTIDGDGNTYFIHQDDIDVLDSNPFFNYNYTVLPNSLHTKDFDNINEH